MASPNKALTGLVSKVLKLSLNKSKSKPKPETLTQRYQDFARSEFGKGKEVESMLNEASKVKDSTKAYNNELEGLKKNYNEFNNPPVKMVSPLNGAYENPRFVDTERGQTASNIASKALLDGAIKKFNDPGVKSKRQKNRADRLTKRANSKKDRLNARADRRDKRADNKSDVRTYEGGSNAGTTRVLRSGKTYDKFNKKTAKIRAKADNKKIELDKRAGEMQVKSDANKMIAEQMNAVKGLTDNQKAIYLNKQKEDKETKNKTNYDFVFKQYKKIN